MRPAAPELVNAFVELVADVTPLEEAPSWDLLWRDLPEAAWRHPKWGDLIDLLDREAVLGAFSESFSLSTGTGRDGAGPETLAYELVSLPLQRLEFLGVDRTETALADAATSVLADACEIAAGNTVLVPARFMFEGPRIARRFSRETSFGRVCWTAIPPPYEETTAWEGLTVFTNVPVHLLEVPDGAYFYSPKFNRTTEAIDRFVSQFRVALLSRGERGEDLGPPARVLLVQLSAVPLGPGNQFLGQPADTGHGGPVRDMVGVCNLMEKYQTEWHEKVDTAARRLGQAMSRSGQDVAGHIAEDGLVDAMIALESMSSMGQELSFRLSTAIAYLLGGSPEERERIYTRVKDLYKLRSAIVHGNTKKVPDVLHAERDDAIRIGIRALEKLLFERRDLLVSNEWEVPLILGL